MKRIALVTIAALALFSACVKEEKPGGETGAKFTFSGTVATSDFQWGTGSTIGVFAAEDAITVSNVKGVLKSGAGSASASFEIEKEITLKSSSDNAIAVYCPYVASATYSKATGTFKNMAIGNAQKQTKQGDPTDPVAVGTLNYNPSSPASFSLTPITSLLKIRASVSSDYAGYGIQKVTLSDDSKKVVLGGTFNVKASDASYEVIEVYNSVSTTILQPQFMNPGEDIQEISIKVLAGNYPDTKFGVALYLVNAEGETLTVPLDQQGLVLEKGKTTTIEKLNISKKDIKTEWFCADDTRTNVFKCAAESSFSGYCYGQANTFLIQCKDGQTYNGATYTPNGNIPSSVTIDYRLRGRYDIELAPYPAEDISFDWIRDGVLDADGANGTGDIYAFKTNTTIYKDFTTATNIDPTKFSFVADKANYTVTVTNDGSHAGAPILGMFKIVRDASGAATGRRLLWAWSFWNIAADGSELKADATSQLANMDIGQASVNYATWGTSYTAAAGVNAPYRTINMYQWGRPLPMFYTNYPTGQFRGPFSAGVTSTETTQQVPQIPTTVSEGTDLTMEQACSYPVGIISGYPFQTAIVNWSKENFGDLWGGDVDPSHDLDPFPSTPDQTDWSKVGDVNTGAKTIYDPCPKGWRVPDLKTFKGMVESTPTFTNTATSGYGGADYSGNYLAVTGYYQAKTGNTGRLTNFQNPERYVNASAKDGYRWTNYKGSTYGGSSSHSSAVVFASGNFSQKTNKLSKQSPSVCAAVRCQVDSENR